MYRNYRNSPQVPGSTALLHMFHRLDRKELWGWVVAYYNQTDVLPSEHRRKTLEDIGRAWSLNYRHVHGLERLAYLLSSSTIFRTAESHRFSFLADAEPLLFRDRRADVDQVRGFRQYLISIASELKSHHAEFCAAIRWLCTTRAEWPKQRVLENLDAEVDHFADADQAGRGSGLDQTTEKILQYLERHGLKDVYVQLWMPDGAKFFSRLRCEHWVDVFCAVVVGECEGKTASEIPIKLCRHCRKLFYSTRPHVRYCDDPKCKDAGWKGYWTRERHRDDQHVRDLEGLARRDLRRRLGRPKEKDRFRRMKRRWAIEWPSIIQRLNNLEQYAASSAK